MSWEGGVSVVWAEKKRRSPAMTTEGGVEVMTTEGGVEVMMTEGGVEVQLERERQGRERQRGRERMAPLGPL